MHSVTGVVLTVLVLGYAVVSAVVNRWYVAPALVFVLLGAMLGPNGFDLIRLGDDRELFTVLAQLALTVILFNQAAALDVFAALRRGRLTFRLLVVGIPLTIGLNTALALALLPGIPPWEAMCLGAIVAPTEVVLIEALLEDTRIPERVRHAMSVESGFYDGFALAALLAALALASERADADATTWAWFTVRTEFLSVGVGIVIGGLAGLLLAGSLTRGWMSASWAQLATLAAALLCFQIGELLHASGFVAAFAGGLVFAVVTRRGGSTLPTQFTGAAAQLLELLVFALFGAYVVIDGWRHADWRIITFAVLVLAATRMLAVSVALIGTDLPARCRVFIGWFGPRGIGTLVLGLIVIGHGHLQRVDLITEVAIVTVTLSLLLHSLTVAPGITWLSGSAVPGVVPSRSSS